MFLASVRDIREQLGFDDMADINHAIETALHAVEPQLASTLRTDFRRGEKTDVFWVKRPTFIQAGHHETQFRMSRGFITGSPLVEVSENPLRFSTATVTPLGDVLTWDRERGVARDWTTEYSRQTVTFTYQYGFEEAVAGDPAQPTGSYRLDQVPQWLQEAATLKTLIHLASNPSLTEHGVSLDVKVLDAQAAALLSQHLRYAPMSILPM